MSKTLLAILVIAAAAAAAIALNLVLLGHASAQNDPVGRLSPRASLPPAPAWTIRPRAHEGERDGNDD